MKYNCYGRERFDRSESAKVIQNIIDGFKKYYYALGYKEESPVSISSGVDSSVRFIGSHISVLKPYLVQGGVPDPGIFIVQNCIRTQNLRRILDNSHLPRWGSFFPSLGVISPANCLNKSVMEALRLMTDVFKIKNDLIIARVSSEDTDLFDSVNEYFMPKNIQVDTMPINYYRHKLGVPELRGRNFNFALKNCDDEEYSDVGNIIILERDNIPVAIELALGSTTIIKQIYGLPHVLDCHSIVGLKNTKEPFGRKLEDCILTSLYLYNEGLRPGGTDNRKRLLKKYLLGIQYFRNKLGLTYENLGEIICMSEKLEFGSIKISPDLNADLGSISNHIVK